ncbi:hypothetical protein PSN45_001643 [Yamadazyma tenuis]|nr:uncharacterized protein CANTEDRAFT_116666 [Yamadazyma tenuis ATCC 10573]EGV61208.1 hypothetical protein CANTEDRAFT_116666 [Yamadazyma tenuis ATCC 10573]WEJ94164.1 hypothetical protein PSN45_001643 [Yamadazyma tenuis]
MDDTIRSLIRFVVRGFYSKEYILIVDAVLIHSVLSEDDLIYLLGIQRKELRMFCNKLVDDRLLGAQYQKEENPQSRQISRTYYYIHITEAVDSIKWRAHFVVNKIKQEMNQFGNPHGYICKRCTKKFSQLDAIALLSSDRSSFVCDNCGFSLVEDDSNEQASIKQESLEKLRTQIDPIIDFLKKIDESVVEDNTFEAALVNAIPAQSSSLGSYSLPSRFKNSKLTANSTANLKSQAATLHVSITAVDENEDKERQIREEKIQKIQQNALPAWHSASTVGKETPSANQTPEPPSFKSEPEIASASGPIKSEFESSSGTAVADETPAPVEMSSELKDKEAQDALTAYYAELAAREAQDDDDEDEDDEDDFDDLEDI